MFFQKRKKLSTVDVLTLNFVAKVTIHPLIMCSSSSFFGTFFKYSYGFDDLSMHRDLELELDLSRSPWSMLLDVGSTFTAAPNYILTGFRPSHNLLNFEHFALKLTETISFSGALESNVSSVVEFYRWWVLKINMLKGIFF